MNFIKPLRLRPVLISDRRIKSPSEMMPTSAPDESTTGSPLICRCRMMFAASTTEVSGVTVITDRVMIWWARIWNLQAGKGGLLIKRILQLARGDLTEIKGKQNPELLMQLNVSRPVSP